MKAAFPDSNERFGSWAVAVAEDEFFVSASEERGNSAGVNGDQDTNGPSSGGAIYQFKMGPTGWEQINYFKSAVPQSQEFFGAGFSVSGDCLVASNTGSSRSAPGIGYDSSAPGIYRSGSASSFLCIRDRWVVSQYFKAPNADSFDFFGGPTAVGDGHVVVCATREQSASPGINGDQSDNSLLGMNSPDVSGAVYVYEEGIFEAGDPFCAAPSTSTCAECPCGNAPASATNGGCVNSRGLDALLTGLGSSGVPEDSLRFITVDGPVDALHILVSGANALPQSGGACPLGSGVVDGTVDGLRCVGGNLIRHGSRISDSNGDVGVTQEPWGRFDRSGPGSLALASIAGQSRYFQVFYRDEAFSGCTAQINTTNAVAITFR